MTRLEKRIVEVARDTGLTVEWIKAELAAGRWGVCVDCGYPTAAGETTEVEGEGAMCPECLAEYEGAIRSAEMDALERGW